jgi:hypothetical protein
VSELNILKNKDHDIEKKAWNGISTTDAFPMVPIVFMLVLFLVFFMLRFLYAARLQNFTNFEDKKRKKKKKRRGMVRFISDRFHVCIILSLGC